ncbi:MAG: hypothetical protein ACR2QE_19370 [Acidimicrobiales bacterium]
MPLSTDKPPAFRWVERFFNHPQDGLANRLAAYQAVGAMGSPGAGFVPSPANTVIGAGSAGAKGSQMFDHFVDHWIGPAGGGGSAFWPTLAASHRDTVMNRVLGGFKNALAASLLVDRGGVAGSHTVSRSLELWWVCASPDANDDLFGTRVFVDDCTVTLMFLTPLPEGITGMTDFSAGGGKAAEVVDHVGNAVRFDDKGASEPGADGGKALAAELAAVADAAAAWPAEGDTCCPEWKATVADEADTEDVVSVPTPATLLAELQADLGYDVFDGGAELPGDQTAL